ncbi:1-deoxy-D-xylulose-5-phosphate synthase N-terminal domain-containing protein, partial [Gluconacetobacter takamatsuzukensis]
MAEEKNGAEIPDPIPTKGRFPLLDRVTTPRDLRNLSVDQLRQLAEELRAETVDAVSTT